MPGAGKWKAAMMAQTLDAIVVEVEARHISGICGQLGLHGKFQDGPNTESYLFKKQNKMEKKINKWNFMKGTNFCSSKETECRSSPQSGGGGRGGGPSRYPSAMHVEVTGQACEASSLTLPP